jgi:hypothetical protein
VATAPETVALSETIDEVREHAFNFNDLPIHIAVFRLIDEAEVVHQKQPVLKLGGGSHRDMKEAD